MNKQKLRVWHVCQVGAVGKHLIKVDNIEEAWKILNVLWDYDLFQYNNHIKYDYCSASGLECWDEEENDWCEWCNEDGLDIKEYFEEKGEKENDK